MGLTEARSMKPWMLLKNNRKADPLRSFYSSVLSSAIFGSIVSLIISLSSGKIPLLFA
jgi:hypothetical protein